VDSWTDGEFAGRDFRDFNDADLSRLRTERVVFTDCDFSGVNLAESQHHVTARGEAALALVGANRQQRAGRVDSSGQCRRLSRILHHTIAL
jgi:uncharacterized protein YjbI with pentapeptide repeats